MKVVTIVGARPQFVKAAVVSRELRSKAGWCELIVHTGQHYDANMSDIFFRELQIPAPDFQLAAGSGSHGEQTAKMLAGIEKILCDVRPDWLIVYGDTNSTLAGALAAAKLHIPIAHIEAGLRSFNRRMPEEINRVLTDHASDLLFAPSDSAVASLRVEGIADQKIKQVGDVMFDAVLFGKRLADSSSQILSRLQLTHKKFVLATVHRAENTDNAERLRAIFVGLAESAKKLSVVVPLHPRTKHALKRFDLWNAAQASLTLIEPVGYLDMIKLQSSAALVATDSGGMQKEAFFCQTPCVTLRDETEWVELVASGWNTLVGPTDPSSIGAALRRALERPAPRDAASNPYGQGDSARRIVAELAAYHQISKAA